MLHDRGDVLLLEMPSITKDSGPKSDVFTLRLPASLKVEGAEVNAILRCNIGVLNAFDSASVKAVAIEDAEA